MIFHLHLIHAYNHSYFPNYFVRYLNNSPPFLLQHLNSQQFPSPFFCLCFLPSISLLVHKIPSSLLSLSCLSARSLSDRVSISVFWHLFIPFFYVLLVCMPDHPQIYPYRKFKKFVPISPCSDNSHKAGYTCLIM